MVREILERKIDNMRSNDHAGNRAERKLNQVRQDDQRDARGDETEARPQTAGTILVSTAPL